MISQKISDNIPFKLLAVFGLLAEHHAGPGGPGDGTEEGDQPAAGKTGPAPKIHIKVIRHPSCLGLERIKRGYNA